jgi:hypothetical protein
MEKLIDEEEQKKNELKEKLDEDIWDDYQDDE